MSRRRQSGAGAGGERGPAAVTAGEGRRPGALPSLCPSLCAGPPGAVRPKLPKQSECGESVGRPSGPAPNGDSCLFFTIIQKLEFGPWLHVPSYVFADPGQEKTERRESFYSALKKKINGKNHLFTLGFTAVMEVSSFVLPFCRSLRNAGETGSITACLS